MDGSTCGRCTRAAARRSVSCVYTQITHTSALHTPPSRALYDTYIQATKWRRAQERERRSTETSALNKRRAGPARADTFDHFRSFRTMAGHTRHCQYALFVCLACLLASSLLTGSCAPVCLVCVPAPPRGGAGPGPRCLTGLHEDTGGSREPGTHETDTRTSQTNPTHRLTRQTTPEPRDARVATHHTTHPIN